MSPYGPRVDDSPAVASGPNVNGACISLDLVYTTNHDLMICPITVAGEPLSEGAG
jgi:hypothetical protein